MATEKNIPITHERTGLKSSWGSAFMVGGTLLDYHFRRKEGEGALPALAKAAASTAFYTAVPWAFGAQLTYMAGKGIATGVPALANTMVGMTEGSRSTNFGGAFQDTQASATMRQRGVASIQRSVMNSRSTLGQEARMMNRG
jgi:hypothetical protein